jgi:peptidoglycan/LPS O-acetylase OafA/YrhL
MTRDGGRIPSLDGLRALSISAVLLGHLAGHAALPAVSHRRHRNGHVDLADLGVRVFFVISGFLITGLLIAEHERSGTISLQRFYLRRTLRIFPAYFAYSRSWRCSPPHTSSRSAAGTSHTPSPTR